MQKCGSIYAEYAGIYDYILEYISRYNIRAESFPSPFSFPALTLPRCRTVQLQEQQRAQAQKQARLEAQAPSPPLPVGAPARHAGSRGAGTRTRRAKDSASRLEKGNGGGIQTPLRVGQEGLSNCRGPNGHIWGRTPGVPVPRQFTFRGRQVSRLSNSGRQSAKRLIRA